MLLTLSTTHEPATELGFLLHKNPERVHTTEMSFGVVTVVYPEASTDRCTAALLVEVDPVGLVRGRKGPKGASLSLANYVNDRPYAASSFLSVAMNKAFGTALTGRSKERQDLADAPIPLELHRVSADSPFHLRPPPLRWLRAAGQLRSSSFHRCPSRSE